jgi:hypothetical protein
MKLIQDLKNRENLEINWEPNLLDKCPFHNSNGKNKTKKKSKSAKTTKKNSKNSTKDGEYQLVAKSNPIKIVPYKFTEKLHVLEKDGQLKIKFSCDEQNKFLVPVGDELNFLHLFRIYTSRTKLDPWDDIYPKTEMLQDLPFEKSAYFYGVLTPDVEKLETKLKFNQFLARSNGNFRTSPWLSEQPSHIRHYYTVFSNSLITFFVITKFSVQLEAKDGIKQFHPMFIRINYPETEHVGEDYKEIAKNMLYNVLDHKMPFDIWAAMHDENILNEPKINKMIDDIKDNTETEKEYLGFVLAAIDEMKSNL